MNTPLTLSFWAQLIGLLALKICFVLALAGLAQKFIHSAAWNRTLWRGVTLCLLSLVLGEISGLSQALFSKPNPPAVATEQAHSLSGVEVRVSYKDLNRSENVPGSFPLLTAPLSKPAAVASNVWWPGQVWLAGMITLGLRLLIHSAVSFKERRQRGSPGNEAISKLTQDLAERMGIRHSPEIVILGRVMSPMALGWIKPRIALPVDFQARYSPAQQAAVLAHELAHVKAVDPLWHLLGRLAVIVCWWHPMVWWGHRQLQAAAELAADEASQLVEQGPEALAECLVQLAHTLIPRARGGLGADGHGFRSSLGRRIQRLLQNTQQDWRPVHHSLLNFGMVLMLFGLFAFANGSVIGLTPRVLGADRAALFQTSPGWNHSLVRTFLAAVISGDLPPSKPSPSPVPETNSSPASADPATPLAGPPVFASFRIDHGVLCRAVRTERGAVNAALDDDALLKEWADALKIDFVPPNSYYLKAESGLLSLRLRPSDMEIVAQKLKQAGAWEIAGITPKSPEESNSRITAQKLQQTLPPHVTNSHDFTRRHTRTFKLDPNVFNNQLRISPYSLEQETKSKDLAEKSLRRPAETIQDRVRETLSIATGINIDNGPTEFFSGLGGRQKVQTPTSNAEPKAVVFYNHKNGILYVRATMEELDAMENFIQIMNTPSQQIMLTIQIFEMPESLIAAIPLLPKPWYSTNVISDAQSRELLAQLQRQQGVDLMTAPRITTISGRQAQIQVTTQKTVVVTEGSVFHTNRLSRETFEVIPNFPATNTGFQTVTFSTGTTADVVPYMRANLSIQLNLEINLLDFAGYDEDLQIRNIARPRFLLTKFTSQSVLWSRQSVICGPYHLPFVRESSSTSSHTVDQANGKVMYCIVSAFWIDPAGNEVTGDWDANKIPEQEFY